MKIVSWNIGRMHEPWHRLLDMDADLALLQEATEPPPEVAGRVEVNPGPWEMAGGYATPAALADGGCQALGQDFGGVD